MFLIFQTFLQSFFFDLFLEYTVDENRQKIEHFSRSPPFGVGSALFILQVFDAFGINGFWHDEWSPIKFLEKRLRLYEYNSPKFIETH